MRKVLAITAVLVALSSLAFAQTPNVQMIFQNGRASIDCTGDYMPGYLVARNFNIWLVGIEYKVNYGAGIIKMAAETYESELVIGNTVTGLSEVWSIPQNAYEPLLTATVYFRCTCGETQLVIQVVPHPESGYVRATDQNLDFVYGYGETSLLCATVPTEDTTWGGIKALYE